MLKRALITSVSLVTFLCVLASPAFGQFGKPTLCSVGQEPQQALTAGFDNDGIPDLATADFTSNDVSILFGNGDGTFQAPRQFSTALAPSSIAVGDFNGDGNLDIAVTEYGFNSSEVAIYLGKGDGTFKLSRTYKIEEPERVLAVDLNGDGHPDLAVLAYCGKDV